MGMGQTDKNICDTHIIGPRCEERFLPLAHPSAKNLVRCDLTLAGVSRLHKPYAMGRVNPGFHLMLHTLRGGGRLWAGGETRALEPGSILLVPAGVAHAYEIEDDSWGIAWVHLRARRIWRRLSLTGWELRASPWGDALESAMEGLLRETAPHGAQRDWEAARHYAELIEILLRREMAMEGTLRDRALRQRLGKVWEGVDANLAAPWTVAALAREMRISSGHFHRLVREIEGAAPMEMVARLRMERAALLLRSGDDTVAEMGRRVGYENSFAFSVAFKRAKGVSPREFRRG